MSKKVSDILPKTEILAQLAEEASELAQAALKLRRALDGTNPTPKSVEECRKAFEEEYADVMVCMAALIYRQKHGALRIGCPFLNCQRRPDTWQHPRSVVVADRR